MKPPKSPPDLSPDIEAVRARIDEWRQTRARRTHMPEDLWQAAVALAKHHGVWRISQALRVRFESLKSRISQPAAPPEPSDPPGFVELTSALGRTRGEGTATTIELSRADGARLSLRFADSSGIDLHSLVHAFCDPSR